MKTEGEASRPHRPLAFHVLSLRCLFMLGFMAETPVRRPSTLTRQGGPAWANSSLSSPDDQVDAPAESLYPNGQKKSNLKYSMKETIECKMLWIVVIVARFDEGVHGGAADAGWWGCP